MRKLTLNEIINLKKDTILLMQYGLNNVKEMYIRIIFNDERNFKFIYLDVPIEGNDQNLKWIEQNLKWIYKKNKPIDLIAYEKGKIKRKNFDLFECGKLSEDIFLKYRKVTRYEMINA